jgi:LysR family transcriptional regulator, cyn operon transcriptional activator
MIMEVRHLRYFAAVVDSAGISAAARKLRITQPALSRQIRDLETELGVRLFDRIGRRLRLTTGGQDLLRRCRSVLTDLSSIEEHAREIRQGTTGLLSVGATPQALESVIAGFLGGFRRRHPTVEVQLVEDGGLALIRRVEQGDVHIALSVAHGDQLTSRLLFPARLLAVGASSRLPRPGRGLEIRDLAGQPLLLLGRDFGSRQWFDAAARLAHVTPRVALESGNPQTLVALAAADHGVAIVPSTLRFAGPGLRALPIVLNGQPVGGWIAANWDSRRPLPPYGHAFVDELAAALQRDYPGRAFDRLTPPVPRPGGAPSRAPRR